MFHGHIGNENKKAREIYKENDKQEKKQQHKKKGGRPTQMRKGKSSSVAATQRMVGHHTSDMRGSATKLTASS